MGRENFIRFLNATLKSVATKLQVRNAADTALGELEVGTLTLATIKHTKLLFGGVIFGLNVSNNATDSANDLDFTTGYVEINGKIVEFNTNLTKRLDATFATGTNQGMLGTGSKAANTTYHVYAIYNSSAEVADIYCDTSLSAANKPSGYEAAYIWSFITDASSNIIQFFQQNGNECYWKTPTDDVSVSSVPSSSGTLYSLRVPNGISVKAFIRAAYDGTASNWVTLNDPQVTDADISGDATLTFQAQSVAPYGTLEIQTNTSRQIRARSNDVSATETLTIKTLGFQLPRGGSRNALVANGSRTVVKFSGNKILSISDRDTRQESEGSGSSVLTVPVDATVNPDGRAVEIDLHRYGSGLLTINAASTVVIHNGANGNTTGHVVTNRYGLAVLIWVGANEWVIQGAIT